MLVRRWL